MSRDVIVGRIQAVASSIQEFLLGHQDSLTSVDAAHLKVALHNAMGRGWLHPVALLPLSDALREWRARRFPRGSAPSPHLLAFGADSCFLSLILDQCNIICTFADVILDASGWTGRPGERLRLLAPLNALPDFILGVSVNLDIISAMSSTTESTDFFSEGWKVDSSTATLLTSILGAIALWRSLEPKFRSVAENPGNRELEAILRTVLAGQRPGDAANVALAMLTHPAALSLLTLSEITDFFNEHFLVVCFSPTEHRSAQRREAAQMYLPLLLAGMRLLDAVGLQAAAVNDINALRKIATAISLDARTVEPLAMAALADAARLFGAATVAASGPRKWECSYTWIALSCIRIKFEGPEAVADAASALLTLLSLPEEWGTADNMRPIKEPLELAVKMYEERFQIAIDAFLHPRRLSEPFSVRYLRQLRCGSASLAAWSRFPELVRPMAMQHVVFGIVDPRLHHFSRADAAEYSDAEWQAVGPLARAFASNCCRAGLVALDGGWAAIYRELESAVFAVQLCVKALADAALFATQPPRQAPSSIQDLQKALLVQQKTAALVLRALYVLDRLGPAAEAVVEGYPSDGPLAGIAPVQIEDLSSLRCCLARMEGVLGPALLPETAPMLRWLAEAGGVNEDNEEEVAAAERLEAMSAAAESRDRRDVATHKARAALLAAGGECAYLGCVTPWAPTPVGAVTCKVHRCAACQQKSSTAAVFV